MNPLMEGKQMVTVITYVSGAGFGPPIQEVSGAP